MTAAIPTAAGAACIGAHEGLPAELELAAFADPPRALVEIERRLEDLSPATGDTAASQRVTLHAMAAEAWRQLGRSVEALHAAESARAIALRAVDGDLAVRVRLVHAMALSLNGSTSEAIDALDGVVADSRDNPRATACAYKDRGWLRYRRREIEPAFRDLTQAYELLQRLGVESEAMVAAGRLASVYRAAGAFEDSERLLLETIGYFERVGARVRVATARDRLGQVYLDQGNVDAAIRQFELERVSSETANDPLGIAYATMRICQSLLSRGDHRNAARNCDEAGERLAAVGPVDNIDRKSLAVLRGRIALAAGDPRRAITHFDTSLAGNADDLETALRMGVYAWRGEALTAVGDYRAALRDAQQLLAERRGSQFDLVTNQLAVERAKSSLALERAKVIQLEQDRNSLALEAARERQQRNLSLAAAVLIALAALLVAFAVNRRRFAETARLAAERRVEELGRISAGIAHDFNNLLTVVNQAIGQLGRHPALATDSGARELIDATREAARNGGEITRQLLAFGRQQNLRPEIVELGDYMSGRQQLFEQSAGPDHVLRVAVSANARCRVDPDQLTTAIANLVINAREASPRGAAITISVDKPAEGDGITDRMVGISVTDHGHGMDPSVRDRATEAFFSTKEPGVGAGLGLSAVEGFVRQSGGLLKLTSAPLQGTTVTMLFPELD
jgi:signal transduction histidine kinase